MKNRYLHLDYVPDADNTAEVLTANKKSSNRQNGGLDDVLELTLDYKEIKKKIFFSISMGNVVGNK